MKKLVTIFALFTMVMLTSFVEPSEIGGKSTTTTQISDIGGKSTTTTQISDIGGKSSGTGQ